jgi:RES domain-containing protein
LITVFRLLKHQYAADPLSPEGARKYGGRWNSKGTPVVYAADSIALAVLEVLVHLHRSEVMNAYSLCTITLPDDLIQSLDPATLPSDWRDDPSPSSTVDIGDQWAASMGSLGLWVPSTIIPQQNNILLNSNYPSFYTLAKTIVVTPFEFDARLARE